VEETDGAFAVRSARSAGRIVWRGLPKTLMACFAILLWMPASRAVTRAWVHNTSNLWSDRHNWEPDDSPPQDGDVLTFFDLAAFGSPDPMNNDLLNLKIESMDFGAQVGDLFVGALDWELDGNALTVLGSITTDSHTDSETVHINCELTLGADAKFALAEDWRTNPNYIPDQDAELDLNGSIDLNGHTLTLVAGLQTRLKVTGVITGTGDIIAKGTGFPGTPGVVQFSGSEGNTFHGTMTVTTSGAPDGGYFEADATFNKTSGVVVSDHLVVENRAILRLDRSEQIGDDALVEILGGDGLTVREAGDDSGVTVGGTPQVSSTILLNGNHETIGSLKMVNFQKDSDPCLLAGGGGILTLQEGIDSTAQNDQATPVIKGRIQLPDGPHTCTVNQFSAGSGVYAGLDLEASLVGTSLAKMSWDGAGALAVAGDNQAFKGTWEMHGSTTLDLQNAQALSGNNVTLQDASSVILRNASFNGSILNVQGQAPITSATTGSFLRAVGNCAWNGGIQLNSNLVVYADNLTLNGLISGLGGIEFLNNTVKIGGEDPNGYTGATLVHCATLSLSKPSGVSAYEGPLVIGGGTIPSQVVWLNSDQTPSGDLTLFANGLVNLNNQDERVGAITFNGGRIDTGIGHLGFTQTVRVNPASTTATIDGFLDLPSPGDAVFNVAEGSASPDLYLNAVISGNAGHLIKQGAGSMRFGRANTYTGVTEVREGALQIDDSASLGSTSAGTTVASNATLQVTSAFANLAEPLSLDGAGIDGTGAALQIVNGGQINLTGPLNLDGPTTINVGTDAAMSINATISGNGSLTKTGQGILSLGGTADNSYSGDTVVSRGTLLLNKPDGSAAVPGRLVIGPAIVRQFSSFTIVGSISVGTGGLWDLNGHAEGFSVPDLHGDAPLTFRNGGRLQTGLGILYLPVGGDVIVNPGLFGSEISGNIGLDPGPHHFVVGRSFSGVTECVIEPGFTISQTSTAADLIKDGTGTLILSATNSYTGSTKVTDGVLQIEGVQSPPRSSIQVSGGILQGAGALGPVLLDGASAVVAPHVSTGIMICDDFAASISGSGTLQVQINGSQPGSGYDQLLVRGICNLSGISLKGSLNFPSAVGDQFTIVQTSPDDPVEGAFNNLPEGALLTLSGELFSISYAAGGGTQVVLTHLSQLAAPTSIWVNNQGGDWNNPANWSTQSVPIGLNAAVTNNGFYTITNQTNISLAQFYYSNPGSTISGTGGLTVSGLFNWPGGSFSGPNTVTANGGLHISGSSIKLLTDETLVNSGAATWGDAGEIFLAGNSVVSNTPSGTFNCTGDATMENGSGANRFDNAGLFQKGAGSGTTQINVPFNNSGTVHVQSGTLVFNNGGTNTGTYVVSGSRSLIFGNSSHFFSESSAITGSGNVSFNNGTFDIAGLVNVAGSQTFNGSTINLRGKNDYVGNDLTVVASTLNFNGSGTVAPATLTLGIFGTLGGSNSVTVTGLLTCGTTSTIQGTGIAVANGGLLISPRLDLEEKTLVNNATALWTNNGIDSITLGGGAVLSNAPGALFDCASSGFFRNGPGSNVVVNLGTFRTRGPTNEIRIETYFNNAGSVEVQSQRLSLAGGGNETGTITVAAGATLGLVAGTHDFDPTSLITGDGDFTVGGGVANLAGTVNITGTHSFTSGTANITGDYLCVGNALTIVGGTANFNGTGTIAPASLTVGLFGDLGGSNLVTVNGPLTLNSGASLSGSGSVVANDGIAMFGGIALSGRTLINLGIASWSDPAMATFTLLNGAILSNAPNAVLDLASDGIFDNGAGANAIHNAGTLRKSSGTNATLVFCPFINTGTVEVQSGTLKFSANDPYTQYSGITRLHGGSLASSSPMRIMGGILKGNGLISGSVVNSGILSPGESPGQIIIAGDYTQTDDGILEIDLGGTNAITGFDQLIVSNTITLGGTLNVRLTNGFSLTPNSSYPFMVGGKINGSFATVNVPFNEGAIVLNSSGTNLTLQVVNLRPKIPAIPDQTITRFSTFHQTIGATDDDSPAQILTYRLPSAPSTATIDPNGVITWTPTVGDPVTNYFTVSVVDNGSPILGAARTFQVVVQDPAVGPAISLNPGPASSHSYTLTFSGTPGSEYVAQYATNMPGLWFNLGTNAVGPNGLWSITDLSATNAVRFYRSRWLAPQP